MGPMQASFLSQKNPPQGSGVGLGLDPRSMGFGTKRRNIFGKWPQTARFIGGSPQGVLCQAGFGGGTGGFQQRTQNGTQVLFSGGLVIPREKGPFFLDQNPQPISKTHQSILELDKPGLNATLLLNSWHPSMSQNLAWVAHKAEKSGVGE